MHCWVCMIDNTVWGLIFYNIWTIKCLICILIKGLAKLMKSPVTDAARGEFEISVRGGRLNELLPQEKEEGIFLYQPFKQFQHCFITHEKFRFSAPVLVSEFGRVGSVLLCPSQQQRGGGRGLSLLLWSKALQRFIQSEVEDCLLSQQILPTPTQQGGQTCGWDDWGQGMFVSKEPLILHVS